MSTSPSPLPKGGRLGAGRELTVVLAGGPRWYWQGGRGGVGRGVTVVLAGGSQWYWQGVAGQPGGRGGAGRGVAVVLAQPGGVVVVVHKNVDRHSLFCEFHFLV